MGSTPNYNLAYFDFRDRLDTTLNVEKEINRFLTIDRQLWGIYNVFGNGVISGWDVFANNFTRTNGLSVSISTGSGIIRYMAGETTFPSIVNFLPTNSIVYIYATIQEATARNRRVSFFYSPTLLTDLSVLLATVATNQNSIVNIDTTNRQNIGFINIIKEQIDSHRHRGTPSKINLENEVKGQLPSARIEGLDASKIISGKISKDRIPILDHNNLENIGQLSHAALDTFVDTLSQDNKPLLGEIASSNLIRQFLFLKQLYSEADRELLNTILFIPSVTNDIIDYENSTTYIGEGCISGRLNQAKQIVSIKWDSTSDFNDYHDSGGVVINNGEIILDREDGGSLSLDNFENANQSNENIASYKKEVQILEDNFKVLSESSDLFVLNGFFSGKFSSKRSYRALFVKEFDSEQNWEDYNKLIFNIKTISNTHGPVYFYFVNKDETESISNIFQVLSNKEVTSNTDSSKNNYKEINIDLIGYDRNKINKIVFFTDDLDNDFSFYIDTITIKRDSFYNTTGYVRYRYSSGASVTFNSIIYDAEIPDGTNISVRIRTAGDSSLLNRKAFSFSLKSGQNFSFDGTDAEIDIILSTTNQLLTPILKNLELRVLASTNLNGFVIDDNTEWDNGTLNNIEIKAGGTYGDSYLKIKDPITVNNLSFGVFNSFQELNTDNVSIFFGNGKNMPLAPSQVISKGKSAIPKFDKIVSAERQFDKTFVLCDFLNHRIAHLDRDGTLIRGYGTNYISDSVFFPLTSNYNPNTKILSIAFSQGIDESNFNIEFVSIYVGVTEIPLTLSDEIISNKNNNSVIEIKLTKNKSDILDASINNMFILFKNGVFPISFDESDNNPLVANRIKLYKTNFTYIEGIGFPIYANISNNSYIVGNAKIVNKNSLGIIQDEIVDDILEISLANIPVSSVIQFNKDTLVSEFTYNKISFSEISLGSIFEIDSYSLALAGIIENSEEDFDEYVTDKIKGYRGIVLILDKETQTISMKYNSPDGLYPSDITVNSAGNILVAESSLINGSGRIVELDINGNILQIFGQGSFSLINDVREVNSTKNMVISV